MSAVPLAVLLSVVSVAMSGVRPGLEGPGEGLELGLVPRPREIEWAGAPGATLGASELVAVDLGNGWEHMATAVGELNQALTDAGLVPLVSTTGAAETVGPCVRVLFMPREGWFAEHGDEAYELRISPAGVEIRAAAAPGIFYGFVTLSQLVRSDLGLPCVVIRDFPDFPIRGTYIAGNAAVVVQRVPEFARLKLNHVLLESDQFYDLDDPEVLKAWQDCFAACRRHGIEPVPELQSLGWGQFVLAQDPRLAEGITEEGREFDIRDGQITWTTPPPPAALAIRNPDFREVVDGLAEGWTHELFRPATGWEPLDGDNPHATRTLDGPDNTPAVRMTCEHGQTVRVHQEATCEPGARYQASCLIRTQDVREGSAYMEVFGLTPEGGLSDFRAYTESVAGTREWHRVAVEFESGSYARVRVYVRLQDASGRAWFADVEVKGLPQVHPLSNIIRTEAAPVTVRSADGATLYEEGRDYTLALPSLSFPVVETPPMGLTLTAGSRIGRDSRVLLSYTRVPAGSMSCCPSEPLYQDFMRTAVQRVVTQLKPRYLHIGHDEPRAINRDGRCRARGLTNSQVFVDDVRRLREYVQEVDPAVRLMMWDDAVNPFQNAPALDMVGAAEDLPRDVIVCLWWYDLRDTDAQIARTTDYFLDLGFEVTGSPWFEPENARDWASALYGTGQRRAGALGLFYTSWAHPSRDPWGALETTADLAWHVRP